MASDTDRHRLEAAERQLALVQGFFPRIDSKVSALFAIASAQIAIAALNIAPEDLKLWYVTIPLAIFFLTILGTIVNLYRCAYPHLEGGSNSLIYFSEIARRREADYIRDYCALSVEALRDDICGQIWRNSEIVSRKYRYLKLATVLNMWSVLPWTAFLLASSLTHARVPVLSS